MHHRVRRLIKREVEVLPLLCGAGDAFAGDGLLEGLGGAANFAVDDVIFEGGAGFDGAVDEVVAEVVDYAGDFADLWREGVDCQPAVLLLSCRRGSIRELYLRHLVDFAVQ